ncbi:hypothetical protein ACGFSB_21930 [Streptomyces sp. NPDC048441]
MRVAVAANTARAVVLTRSSAAARTETRVRSQNPFVYWGAPTG